MKSRLVNTVLAIALGSGLFAASSHAQDNNAYLYLVHAAPGRNAGLNPAFPVDISINGTCVVKAISFGEIRGPYAAPAGTFSFAVSFANSVSPCANAPIFSATSPTAPANTYVGVMTLDASNAFTGQLYPLNLSSIPAGSARAFVINATTQDLGATVTGTPTTDGSGGLFAVSAGTMGVATPPLGVFYTSIYMNGTTLEAGPVQIQTLARNAYIYVFAGSPVNGSVELIGPKVIYGVF